MKRGCFIFGLLIGIFFVSYSQSLDISGYKIVQANAPLTITLPPGTFIDPGGYLVIGRNQAKSAFESFWGITLGSYVVYINGITLSAANGFPTINGDENYTLQNSSVAGIDGPTISQPSTPGGQSIKRQNASSAAGVEGSWTRIASTPVGNANPGSGMVNTNTGKLIISEFSDASTFNNEFVELFYDVTPIVKGEGSVIISPTLFKYNASTQLQFVFKPEIGTLKGLQFVKPAAFNWNSGSITVQPNTASISSSNDTVTIANISLSGNDSVTVLIPDVTAPDTCDQFSFSFKSSLDGLSFLPLNVQSKVSAYGSPRPLSYVKGKDVSGNHIFNGKHVVVQGIVTVANEFSGPTYLQDETAGIAVYDSSVSNKVERGDKVILLGVVSPYNGMFELNPCSILEKLSEGNSFDTLTLTIEQITAQPQSGIEPYECRLVRINNINSIGTISGNPTTPWSVESGKSGANYKIFVGMSELDIRVAAKSNLANTIAPNPPFDVVGVLGQYLTYYQILPRSVDDVIAEGQGPRITITPPYESNITSTSITFNWTTDVAGNSIVAFGKTTAYGDTLKDLNLVTQHSITLTELDPAALYNIKLGSANEAGTTYTPNYIVSTASQNSTGAINVFFNRSVNTIYAKGENAQTTNLGSRVVARINAATYSIDAAIYSLSGNVGATIATALIAAKNRGVSVRIIGEKDNQGAAPWATLKNNGITVIDDGYDATNAGAGLMHNKFYIFDNRDATSETDDWVITGSWNATDSGTDNDSQNIIEIQDKALANAFTTEFNEMWGSTTETPSAAVSRFGARKYDNTPHFFNINGMPVELYFSPSDRVSSKIVKTLNQTTGSAYVALLTFTRNDIANSLIAKQRAGIPIKVIMDNKTDQGSVFDTLQSSGIDVRLKGQSSGLLHHKYAIVNSEGTSSNQYVITGSHNWSSSAENSNNENTLILKSARITNLYLQEFAARYTEAGGTEQLVSVEEQSGIIPTSYAVTQNYPNPFNPSTVISFQLPVTNHISLKVFDVLGRHITTLINEVKQAGAYNITWNASTLPSGVYFYQINAGKYVAVKKAMLVK